MSGPDLLKVIRYETLLECMAAFLGCEVSEVEDRDGTWIWGDWAGKEHRMSMKEAISKILSDDEIWGWLEDKEIMHLWFEEGVDSKKLIGVIAHEIGHTCRPFHRGAVREEQKACMYGMVAGVAFDIMNDLLEN
jgi:hypothetical protein